MKSDFSDYAVNDKTFNTDREIHLVYGGQDKNTNKNIIVGTWQSLYKLPKVWFEQFDVIICDEAHLGKSASITSILKKTSNTKIKIGTTGTLDGTKVNQLILEGYLGPVFSVISTKELIDNNFLAKLSIHCICLKYPEYECKLMKETTYDEEVKYIIKHERRNRFITNLTKTLNDTTLILFEFVDDHGKILHSMIEKSIKNRNVYFVYGGTPSEEREEIRKKVENERGSIIVASVKVFSTGVNIKNLDNIIFVSPTKSRIRSLQSIGRVLRIGDYSNKANLYDIVDDFSYKNRKNYALKHFLERAKVYDSEKFDYKIHKVVF
jgi:superfamily II DNA or RNA helicase